MKNIILHCGMHKTGTTSIQHFLMENNAVLNKKNMDYYKGIHIPSNHVELHTSSLRPERMTPFKLSMPIDNYEKYRKDIELSILTYLSETPFDTCIFSAEGNSYIRYEDEMNRLLALFPGCQITIVICFRNKEDYFISYQKEMKKHNPPPSDDRNNFAYSGKDHWLMDYDEKRQFFIDSVGKDNVLFMDYDKAIARDGNIIPEFLRTIGVLELFNGEPWGNYFQNKTLI
ncbi:MULTISPECIES: hypothetical protein [Dickeya]|uniref:Sulfotransferase family protein n=1 Tax=Dickeya aquatica TaxID=1401087 RepID=A0A375AEC7_9GAMM|nr:MULTISPECIES: hypothetical protein [Dickeya]SLM64454.1 hypothetical protein DAQ1742_03660 [Dickeya aquatica]